MLLMPKFSLESNEICEWSLLCGHVNMWTIAHPKSRCDRKLLLNSRTNSYGKYPEHPFPVRPASGRAQHQKDIPRPDAFSTPPRTGWVKDPVGAAKRRGHSPASFTQTSMVAGLQSGGLTTGVVDKLYSNSHVHM